MNFFWTGVYRSSGRGLDQIKIRCCEMEYHQPITGNEPVPSWFRGKNGKYSFNMDDQRWGNKWLRMHDHWVDLKNDKLGGWEGFDVVPVDIKKGLYKIKNHQGHVMACEGKDSDKLQKHAGDHRLNEFQFFLKGDKSGIVIYNPFTQRFVGPYDDGNIGCHSTEVHHANHFLGIKRPMDEKFRLKMYPSLFRTELTAEGYGNGWGF